MKGFLICMILSLSTLASARVYYVQDPAYNENASDMNAGTDIDRPWATWQKAFNTARAGDTVYFRGGTWYPRTDDYGNVTIFDPQSGHGSYGTYSNPICFVAYPPDVEQGNMPILNCIYTKPTTDNHVGLYIRDARYVEFKGLKITNVRSWPLESGEMWCAGIMAYHFDHLSLEHMTASYIGGAGILTMGHDTLYLINCDAHNNCDSLDVAMPGNDGDGFTIMEDDAVTDTFKIAYISGCRTWNNSDDGFNISTKKQLDMHDCWSWGNGYLEGDANGFKMTYSHMKTAWKRRLYNSISAYNENAGFTDLNLNTHMGPFTEYYNNSTYKDGQGFGSSKGQEFDCSTDPATVIYRNNISFASTGPSPASFKACDYGYPTYVIQDHNTWVQTGDYFHTEANDDYAVSENEFASLDTAQLRWPRKADGSLPDIDFMKLRTTGNDLVDGGIDVGLSFYGSAPDLGAFENSPFSVELISPSRLSQFRIGDLITIQAKVDGISENIDEVLFYSEDRERLLGTGEQVAPSIWQFAWECDTHGFQDLRAVAFNSQNETATSSILKIQVRWPLHDIPSPSNGEDLCKIIPNPNDGLFSLEFQEPLKKSLDIQVISISGQLMAVERILQDEIMKQMDLSDFPPGLYTIHFGDGNYPSSNMNSLKMVRY